MFVYSTQVFRKSIKYISDKVRIEESHFSVDDLLYHDFVKIDRRFSVEREKG